MLTSLNNPDQDPAMRLYRRGYEGYFNRIPVLDPDDPLLDINVSLTVGVMDALRERIASDGWAVGRKLGPENFARTILGLESPRLNETGQLVEGTEVLVAHWGTGFTSPVHGHAPGFEYEALINGSILVNTYRMTSTERKSVRLVSSEINDKPGRFISWYQDPRKRYAFPRSLMIHNFTALEPTTSLHYLTEHTRDGRDNSFEVEYFEDRHVFDVDLISAQEGLALKKGEVVLVRSANVSEYGDHFIVITGHPVMKPHGLRPQDRAFIAPHAKRFIDMYEENPRRPKGLTLLKLNDEGRRAFHEFHGITMVNGEVVFPEPTALTL